MTGVTARIAALARARDRDVAAFEMLVRRYERWIYRLCLRMPNGASAEAEDVTQEVFLTAWRRLLDIEQDAAFGGWLYRTATNRCLTILRRRRPTAERDAPAAVGDDPARAAQNRHAMEVPTAALATLPAQQRACWLLREVHGRSYEEIARLVGITTSAVRGRIARARGELNDTTTDHALPCGRSVEQVWTDVETGRAGPHPDCPHPDCPHRATARRSLDQLAEATRALVDDPAEPATSLLDRIMAAVRADIGLGESVALPAPGGGLDISVHALSAVLRFAVDTVDGVRAHRCRITVDDADPYAVHVVISVSLRFGSGRVLALDKVPDRVEAALSQRVGLRLLDLDLDLDDV